MPVVVGSYRKAMTSGTVAAGLTAASLVYGFKWSPTTTAGLPQICQIRSITVAAGSLVGFTAGFLNLQAFAIRDYKTLEGTGGTAGLFTGSNGKLATAMPTSNGAACYISTTAAISAGVGTVDTDPFAQCALSAVATAGLPPVPLTDLFYSLPDEPKLTLVNNEGFVIKATVPATGTWQLGVTVAWDELV